jgi:hypothetical protein
MTDDVTTPVIPPEPPAQPPEPPAAEPATEPNSPDPFGYQQRGASREGWEYKRKP